MSLGKVLDRRGHLFGPVAGGHVMGQLCASATHLYVARASRGGRGVTLTFLSGVAMGGLQCMPQGDARRAERTQGKSRGQFEQKEIHS